MKLYEVIKPEMQALFRDVVMHLTQHVRFDTHYATKTSMLGRNGPNQVMVNYSRSGRWHGGLTRPAIEVEVTFGPNAQLADEAYQKLLAALSERYELSWTARKGGIKFWIFGRGETPSVGAPA